MVTTGRQREPGGYYQEGSFDYLRNESEMRRAKNM